MWGRSTPRHQAPRDKIDIMVKGLLNRTCGSQVLATLERLSFPWAFVSVQLSPMILPLHEYKHKLIPCKQVTPIASYFWFVCGCSQHTLSGLWFANPSLTVLGSP